MTSPGLATTARSLLALESAPADEILPTLAELLADEWGASDVRLHVVDYRLRVLTELDATGAPTGTLADVEGSPPGRVFTTQSASVTGRRDGARVLLPVSVRGDRLGVLSLLLAQPPSEAAVGDLVAVATALAHAIAVVARETDAFEIPSRAQRLGLAAELQWQLLPGRACAGDDFAVAGQLEPAYHVGGDAFDWSVSRDAVLLVACEGTGEGVAAAQLTNLAVTALRNARRAGLPLDQQAALAADAVHAARRRDAHVGTLLARVERASGRAEVLAAGSQVLFRQRGRTVERVGVEAQVPFGAMAGYPYRTEQVDLAPGDRLVVLSDGFAGDGDGGGEVGGQLSSMVDVPAAEVVRRLLRVLVDAAGQEGLPSDAVALVFDRRGADGSRGALSAGGAAAG